MKKTLIIFFVSCFALNSYALTVQDLFKALKKQPVTKVNSFIEQSAQASKTKAVSVFYPKIYGLVSYEHFSSPTNLRPITPTESAQITKAGEALPFSNTIKSLGIEVDVPVFVYPLFSLAKKAEEMAKSAKEKMRLNLLSNEAAIIVLNAKLEYLERLHKAMISRRASLKAQLKSIDVGVKVGRIPKIQAFKIENMINLIDIDINQLKISKQKVISSIETLTSIKLTHSVSMKQLESIKENNFFTTKPLEYVMRAQKYNVAAKRSELYPSFYLKGFAVRKFGTSYNTDEPVLRNYGSIGLYMQVPIFNKTIYTDIQKAKSDYLKSEFQLQQLKIELSSEAESLNSEFKILTKSIEMTKKSVENQQKLLKYAQVAFKTRRMTEEEYLRYEDELLNAQANLFSLKAKKWDVVSKLAVIYGNDLEGIVK